MTTWLRGMVKGEGVARVHRLYLSPGMFGFGKLASYDYFAHVEKALKTRFRHAGEELVTHVADVAPTASIRRRAAHLAELVTRTAGSTAGVDDPLKAPIHLLGHSTGGLDARLVASPSARLSSEQGELAWLPRLRSVTMMNTPHYGTPLAGFFATVSGQRMLYALSAITVIGLTLGAPPLAAASALVMAIGSTGRKERDFGGELRVLDRITDALLGVLEPATDREVRTYLEAIRRDQGAVVQLTPEAMDLFLAGVEDREGVLYQSTCAMTPAPSAGRFVRALGHPWSVLSTTLFTTMHGITSRYDACYPCAAADVDEGTEAALVRALGRAPGTRSNDGVVPLRSQIWGTLAWVGYADHLDVLGHFAGARSKSAKARTSAVRRALFRPAPPVPEAAHIDWLASGANFDEAGFDALMDAVASGMLRSSTEASPKA